MNRRARLLAELRAVAVPLVAYGLTLLVSLAFFWFAVFVDPPPDPMVTALILGSVTVGTLGGMVLGQVASLLRIRSTLFHLVNGLTFVSAVYIGATFGKAIGEIGAFVVFISTMGCAAANGAFLSLRTNRGVAATWAPLMLATISILICSDQLGNTAAWHAGDKHGIWGAATLLLLLGAIASQLAFLAAREHHRLHRWRTAPVATELLEHRPDPFRPLHGCGTVVSIGALLLFLTASAALVAPYLWRTAPPDEDGVIETSGVPEEEAVEEEDEKEGPGLPDLQTLQEAVQQGVQATCALLTLVVLGILGLFVFGLPLRRQLLLTHLRDPLWPVPPSRQAHLHWRLAEIAFGDAGLHRQPHETALDLSRRAVHELPELDPEALEMAGRIADRVAYGYALEPSDPEMLGRAAEMTYQGIWESLSEWERIKATYRWL